MARGAPAVRYRVHLGSDALWACEVRGRSCVVRKARFEFDPGAVATSRPQALEALRAWMALQSARGTQAWVLGLAEVRYLLLPWTPDLADARLREAFAAARFEQQFKQAPGAYAMRFARPAYGAAMLVACVPQELLAALEAHAVVSGVRLTSVTPSLSAVWDRFRPMLGKESGALCLVDGDRQIALRHVQGRFDEVALRPFDAAHEAQQAPASEALQGSLGGDRQRVFAAIPLHHVPADAVLTLADGDGFLAQQDRAFAYALCGVF